MLLEKNWLELSIQRKKHIWVQYFLIKDRIAVGDVTLDHFPMDKIIGYHFRKTLPRFLSRKFYVDTEGIPDDTG